MQLCHYVKCLCTFNSSKGKNDVIDIIIQLDNLIGNPSDEGMASTINHLTRAFCAVNSLWCPGFDLRVWPTKGLKSDIEE